MQHKISIAALICVVLLTACSSSDDDTGEAPMLTPAQPGTRQACESFTADFAFERTTITSTAVVAAVGADPEYCAVTGSMNAYTSAIDGNTYAIGFEMRLPTNWNGRFLYQGNGGVDGDIAAAIGRIGSPNENALQKGFAIISSDAGHPTRSAAFGLEPQARLDFGYQAVGTLTPMAKALIQEAYGRAPDRSYIGGSSNGGRHAMVAASRFATDYDGILALSPGFNLPLAAVAQLWGAQQWNTVATATGIPTNPDTGLATALTSIERNVIADAILAKCDELDGLVDGMVQNIYECQEEFDLVADVPVCAGVRDGTCISSSQQEVIGRVFDGATTSDGQGFYNSWVFDPGIRQQNWADWKFKFSVNDQRDAVAYAYIFSTPPKIPGGDTFAFAMALDINEAVDSLSATNDTYTESSLSFMTPPNPTNLNTLRFGGGKMLVVHGASDGVFSMDDTVDWYQALDKAYGGNAEEFARLFLVPGMGHSGGGPATDQFDALQTLIDWVENGVEPERIIANVQADNPDVISQGWPASRQRPLCLFPSVATYDEEGDSESAESFTCQ